MKANKEIRERAKSAGIYSWQVAAALGMNDGNFSRKLRRELPVEEKAKIIEIINESGQVKKEAAYG